MKVRTWHTQARGYSSQVAGGSPQPHAPQANPAARTCAAICSPVMFCVAARICWICSGVMFCGQGAGQVWAGWGDL